MASTLLMVLHPELHHYFPTELTEPIFLFGAFLWIFGIVRIGEQPFQPNKYIALAAIGLMLTLLVKPVLQFICLLILITTLIIWLWPQNNQKKDNSIARRFARAIALSTTFALLPAAGVALKNGILFGVWGIATGSGAALYLGVHPLSIGTEPAYFGLTYDVSKLALMVPGTDGDHLHPAADSLLKAVALDFLKNMTIEDAVIYFGRKLWWWAFDFPGTKLRTFRALEWLVLLLGAAYTALCWLRSRSATVAGEATNRRKLPAAVIQPKIRFIILVGLGIILTGMLVQLQVVLYNSRYSVVAVEPWLLILTGVSAAALMRPWRTFLRRDSATVTLGVRLRLMSGKPRVLYAASMALLLAGPSAFIHWTKHYENLELDPQHLGPVTSVFSADGSINIVSDGMTRITTDLWRMDTSPAALIIPAAGPFSWPALSTNDIWLLNFSVSTSAPMNCRFAELAYTQPQVTETHSIPRLAIRADARAHAYAVHANRELRPAGPGSMRIAFHCPIGTTVQWDRMQLLSSDTVTMAARHIPLTKSVEPSSANTAR